MQNEHDTSIGCRLERLVVRLNQIERYEITAGSGRDNCCSWVEHDNDKDGDWVKWEDLEAILKDC